jgi:CHASE3 domain sensor protein
MDTYDRQVENIKRQIEATERQLALERDKKDTDESKIISYQEAIDDAYDELDELKQKQIEVFGGIGEEGYRSAAEGFVDAWKEAFLETGDGLQGLQDHFDEFLQEWFVKQATMRIAGKMLEKVFTQIDKAVDKYSDGGTSAMLSEIQNVKDMASAIFPDLSEALEELAGMFDLQGEGGLSGLAAGIQGMTEEQANILEAYWNSVRMYTANIDINVERIASILGAGGINTNPMLDKLDSIINNTSYIKRIYDMLEPMQTNNGNGRGFRTYNL